VRVCIICGVESDYVRFHLGGRPGPRLTGGRRVGDKKRGVYRFGPGGVADDVGEAGFGPRFCTRVKQRIDGVGTNEA
jgi:hypothetical protein